MSDFTKEDIKHALEVINRTLNEDSEARLIDANKYKNILGNMRDKEGKGKRLDIICDCIRELDKVPTVKAVPTDKMQTLAKEDDYKHETTVECRICRKKLCTIYHDSINIFGIMKTIDHCPHCGWQVRRI